jgi:hypothetical protein
MSFLTDIASLLAQAFAFAQAHASSILSGTVVVAVVGWLYTLYCDWRDSRAILNFLKGSAAASGYQFRSSEAISAATKISKARVERLCIRHKQISRNGAQKESWQLAG